MSAGRKINSTKKDWQTPPKYIEAILKVWDFIYLDPCSNETSLVPALEKFTLPKDGLNEEWDARTTYINPPYGRDSERGTSIYDWVKKGVETYKKYNNELIYLIPSAPNTRHFKQFIFKEFVALCFLEDTRLKFYNNGIEDKKGAPMACCMCYLGRPYKKFKDVFDEYGKVFLI